MTVSILFAKVQDLITIQNALGNPKVLSIGQTDCTDMMNDSVVNEVVFADFGLTEAQVMEVLYNTDDVDFYPCGCVEGVLLYSPLYGDVLASDGSWWSQDGDYMGSTH
jgi:hypothetical protein